MTIILLLIPLMALNPQQLYAMRVQASRQQAPLAAVLVDIPVPEAIGYRYDDKGNLIVKGPRDPTTHALAGISQEYRYGFENRLIQSRPEGLPENETTIYTYDADGLRVGQACSTSATKRRRNKRGLTTIQRSRSYVL